MTPFLTTMLTFTGQRPAAVAAVDPVQDVRDRKVDVVHPAEDLVVERVEAHGDPSEARVREGSCLAGQERAVRRQGEIEAGNPGEHRDELLDVATKERLPAGEADLLDAELDEHPGEAGDLLEGQELVAPQEFIVMAEHVLGHAVGTAEVTAVGDRDPQITKRPPERVSNHAVRVLHASSPSVERSSQRISSAVNSTSVAARQSYSSWLERGPMTADAGNGCART